MTPEFRIELLAQALWLRHFGLTHIVSPWETFAEESPQHAGEFRDKAQQMLQEAAPHKYHSLGWLYGQ